MVLLKPTLFPRKAVRTKIAKKASPNTAGNLSKNDGRSSPSSQPKDLKPIFLCTPVKPRLNLFHGDFDLAKIHDEPIYLERMQSGSQENLSVTVHSCGLELEKMKNDQEEATGEFDPFAGGKRSRISRPQQDRKMHRERAATYIQHLWRKLIPRLPRMYDVEI